MNKLIKQIKDKGCYNLRVLSFNHFPFGKASLNRVPELSLGVFKYSLPAVIKGHYMLPVHSNSPVTRGKGKNMVSCLYIPQLHLIVF